MPNHKVVIPPEVFLPCYRHLLTSSGDINFLWGGRDSGKSHFIAQCLILKCLFQPYFRCILIKKRFNTIQESQWQTIKDICEDWKISHLFNFVKAPLSITCVNGNKFIARGLDDPQSIKSVRDPSDAWHEEGNQETLDEFITVTTSLRTNKARIQQWFSFNPECEGDFKKFWLYENFFKDKPLNGTFLWEIENPKKGEPNLKFSYTSTHTTYHNNPHVSPTRIIFLEKLKTMEKFYYQVYTKGLWGRRKNNSPFCYAYDAKKHVGKTKYNPMYELYASFDFNRDPICCNLWQYYGGTLYGIEAVKLEDSNIYKLCDVLVQKYPKALWLITGDATGKASSALVQDGLNYYTVIKSKLGVGSGQIKVPSVNPTIKENQVLVNSVLQNIPMIVDEENCESLIFDFENVRVQADGSIEKRDRSDATQQSDQLDAFRYLCNQFFKWILKQ